MKRRRFIQCGLGFAAASSPALGSAEVNTSPLARAADYLQTEVDRGRVHAAAIHVTHRGEASSEVLGAAGSTDAMFLLASISKPISIAALMTLFDQGEFKLDDRVSKFIPEFVGKGREDATIRNLLTHTSGLPDQLPENKALRQAHEPLAEFTRRAIGTPLLFRPGAKYSYSSMGILIASEIAQRISQIPFPRFVDQVVFEPLKMTRSSLGLGRFPLEQTVRSQVENAAPESGRGDRSTRHWDWNSEYWRNLASPWGGVIGSAPDAAKFFSEFLHPTAAVVQVETAKLMTRNQNPASLRPRGLGFDVGVALAPPGCSQDTFWHTGSTGTIAWADPKTDTVCVVLTTLPGRAASPHPRETVSRLVAEAVRAGS